MNSICVFCGSAKGARPEYIAAAKAFGQLMGEQGLTLYYGGASVGLMGAVADGCLAANGKVIGVLPEFLGHREIAHPGLTELKLVDTLFTRKKLMMQAADAFVSLPGGLGTLDELFEVWTWAQLNQLRKPVAILNTLGFYDHLLAMTKHAGDEGFIRQTILDYLFVEQEPEKLLNRLRQPLPALDTLQQKLNHAKG
jgi:uncharacterized protein (TIGR00730 family)